MWSLAVNIWMGNDAAVPCGRWGAVTRRAREVGYSRTAIYNHAQRVTQAVVHAQEDDVSSEAVWAENARLQQKTRRCGRPGLLRSSCPSASSRNLRRLAPRWA